MDNYKIRETQREVYFYLCDQISSRQAWNLMIQL